MAVLKLEWDGNSYEVDIESVTPKEFRSIKTHLGLKAGAFVRSFENLDELDADAIVGLLWLGEKRSGNPTPQFHDDIPWLELMGALTGVEGVEEVEQAPKADS